MSSSKILLGQIAPQRSTQYAALATDLAPAELLLSPFGQRIQAIVPCELGDQTYLRIEMSAPLTDDERHTLGTLAMTSGYFFLYDQIGEREGPFLLPIESGFIPQQPLELSMARRYKGKTNELFTQWLCNIAKFSSAFSKTNWSDLTVIDPLSGGGTTLFVALVLGAGTVAGVEQDLHNSKSTASFLQQFAQEKRISARLKEERLKKLGRRWTVSVAPIVPTTDHEGLSKAERERRRQTALFASGDTVDARQLLPGIKAHLIVTDLPYGIQHGSKHPGRIRTLLEAALPVWASMLRRGGTLVMAWDATTISRKQMHSVVAENSDLSVLHESPYDQFEHRVDRVIKQRDVLVARR
ncbi:MAG: hypothetical protein AAF702_25490 [Chloroflexota bacterium]